MEISEGITLLYIYCSKPHFSIHFDYIEDATLSNGG